MNIKDLMMKAKSIADIAYDEKDFAEVETKANEVVHTQNAGLGKEIIPTNVMSDNLLDLLPQYSRLLPLLPGNHGNDMPISSKVPVIGEAGLFSGNSEWTSGDGFAFVPTKNWPATGEVVIVQGQFILDIAISKRELNYAPAQLESIIRERMNRSAARTIDAVIINGDTASTGNVNGTYNAKAYFTQIDNGIRKVGIANTVVNVGAMTAKSYLDVVAKLDEGYQSDLENLLIIEPNNVYMKSLAFDEVITVDKFGSQATINSGVLAKVWNIDKITARDFPALTASTGAVSATGSENTKGSFAVIYKPAIQYGFGQPLEIDAFKVPGKGVQLVATMEFGFAIADEVAGLGKTVGLGANVTL